MTEPRRPQTFIPPPLWINPSGSEPCTVQVVLGELEVLVVLLVPGSLLNGGGARRSRGRA